MSFVWDCSTKPGQPQKIILPYGRIIRIIIFFSILKTNSGYFYNLNVMRSVRKLSAAISMITAIPVLITIDFHFFIRSSSPADVI